MRKVYRILPLAVVLAAGVCFLAVARARDDDEQSQWKAAQAAAVDIQKLADALDQPDELKKQTDAIVKKYKELSPIMRLMKAHDKGGLVVGSAAGAFPLDSIELGLLQLAKKPPTADKLAVQAPLLNRMAEIVCAIAEVTPHYGSQFVKSPGGLRRWNGFANDMGEGGRDLCTAIKAGDLKNFRRAVAKLNESCNECHVGMRDGTMLDDIKQAAAAVNNAELLKMRAQTLVRRYSLDYVSRAFESREKGGLGFRPLPVVPPVLAPYGMFVPYDKGGPAPRPAPAAAVPDSIEANLLDVAKNPPTAAQLAADAKDLQRAAEVARALAEAMPGYGKEYAAGAAAARKWDGFSDDMKQGSDDLIGAVKGKDLKGLQKALDKLNQSCTDCHKAFR